MAVVKHQLFRIEPVTARFVQPPSFAVNRGTRKSRGAFGRGLAHEDNVFRFLDPHPGLVPGPWIEYTQKSGRVAHAQPDFLVFIPESGRLLCLEAKLRHCAAAYYQLRNLYEPLLRLMFPSWEIRLQEVVRWYDPHEHFPGMHCLRENLLDPPPNHEIGVHVFNGGRRGRK